MAELLAPAGNVEALDAAIGEGADAVYLGLKSFNARLRSTNFAWNQFEAAVQSLHRQGKKIYVTVNTVSEEREMERLYRFLSYLNRIGPDGLIVQDFGVIRMCQEFFPKLELHASTQMNVASAAGVNILSRSGLKRVVLARELGLEEIQKIKSETNAELEIFVHGALCVSESGLCLFSSFLGGKSANRGMCTQACRRLYTADVSGGTEQGYYFSPSDLQLIDRIPDLMTAGVESFKIEGRMKSAEYVGSVVAAYRYLMDHWQEDRKGSVAAAKRMLSTDFARSKTTYWYNFTTNEDGVNNAGAEILNPGQAGGTGIYLGVIDGLRPADEATKKQAAENASPDADPASWQVQMALIKGGSYDPDQGDSIRLHRKDDTGRASHKVRTVETDENGSRWIDVPVGFTRGDPVYLLQTKSMSKRYPRVLPGDIGRFRSQPGAEQLPVLDITPVAKDELSYFPEGLYIQISTVNDMFVVQSQHPVRVILELNHETKNDLLTHKTVLPFSKKQVIISLDPFCPAATESELAATLDLLIADGFTTFIANNTAHLALLRGKKAKCIAGPYLYTFNRWAVSWLENQSVGAFITPLENSKDNLELTFDAPVRDRVMITIFAYPALFRIRFKLPKSYDFTYFTDKEGMEFKVNSTPDGSFVMPELPFSIVDKVELLDHQGFHRVLIDFSRTKVTKSDFKKITGALIKKQVIPETSRFNWKDGFYDPEKIEEFRQRNERTAAEQQSMPSRGSGSGKRTGRSEFHRRRDQ
jgi:U32 family peptidase